jgi:hypothetical protein
LKLLDTQVISYKYKGAKEVDIKEKIIPSVVALEFLLLQSYRPYSANYYVPKTNRLHLRAVENMKIDHAFRKSSTDSIIFDFGHVHGPFAMFSNFSISDLINRQNVKLFDKAIYFLDKEIQKDLKKKITGVRLKRWISFSLLEKLH